MRSLALPLVLLAALGGCSEDKTRKVTSIEPNTGDAEGGSYVRIRGNRFLTDDKGDPAPANAKIYFGNRLGTIDRFQADDEIIVQAPGGKPGETVDVTILFEGQGELKLPHAFTFVEKKQTGPSPDDLIKKPGAK